MDFIQWLIGGGGLVAVVSLAYMQGKTAMLLSHLVKQVDDLELRMRKVEQGA